MPISESLAYKFADSLGDMGKFMHLVTTSNMNVQNAMLAAGIASTLVWIAFHTDTINNVATAGVNAAGEFVEGFSPGSLLDIINVGSGA